jgi:hypothetical protein
MRRAVLVVLLALMAVGCQGLKPDPAAMSAQRRVFDQLRAGQDSAILAQLPPQLNTPATQATLGQLRAMLPAAPPRSEQMMGSNFVDMAGAGRSLALVVEYDFPDRTAQLQTNFVEPAHTHGWQLNGFHLQVAAHKQLAANDLNILNRPIVEVGLLGLALASPLLMIAALVKVVRTRGLKRKWLWGLLSFVGLFGFRLNWTTSQVAINWITVQFIGAGMTRSLSKFDPWVVSWTLPIGALLILVGVWANPARARKPSPASADSAPWPGR